MLWLSAKIVPSGRAGRGKRAQLDHQRACLVLLGRSNGDACRFGRSASACWNAFSSGGAHRLVCCVLGRGASGMVVVV